MLYTTQRQTFGAVRIQQTWSALFVLETVLTEHKPDLIIELGTGYGALSKFFSLFAPVVTFDVRNLGIKKHPGVTFYHGDIFNQSVSGYIKSLIAGKRIFLFCDNGNKPREFKTFVPMLKPGDVVFVHDYGLEIKNSDMKETVDSCGLVSLYQELCHNLKTLLRGFVVESKKKPLTNNRIVLHCR